MAICSIAGALLAQSVSNVTPLGPASWSNLDQPGFRGLIVGGVLAGQNLI